jgi:hypothetical protein
MRKRRKKVHLLTGTQHGDAVSELLGYFQGQVKKLEEAQAYFMAGVALGAALETALLGYMLVEWDEEHRVEAQIPADVALEDFIQAAEHFDLLNAVQFAEDGHSTSISVKTVIRDIQAMRNYLHPAKVLRKSLNPASFGEAQYKRLRNIYTAVIENLMRNL